MEIVIVCVPKVALNSLTLGGESTGKKTWLPDLPGGKRTSGLPGAPGGIVSVSRQLLVITTAARVHWFADGATSRHVNAGVTERTSTRSTLHPPEGLQPGRSTFPHRQSEAAAASWANFGRERPITFDHSVRKTINSCSLAKLSLWRDEAEIVQGVGFSSRESVYCDTQREVGMG